MPPHSCTRTDSGQYSQFTLSIKLEFNDGHCIMCQLSLPDWWYLACFIPLLHPEAVPCFDHLSCTFLTFSPFSYTFFETEAELHSLFKRQAYKRCIQWHNGFYVFFPTSFLIIPYIVSSFDYYYAPKWYLQRTIYCSPKIFHLTGDS